MYCNILSDTQGWEFALWFFVRIARFLQQRVNHSFDLFVKERQERFSLVIFFFRRTRTAMNLKEQRNFSSPISSDSSRNMSDSLIKRTNCSAIQSKSLLCSKRAIHSFCFTCSVSKERQERFTPVTPFCTEQQE